MVSPRKNQIAITALGNIKNGSIRITDQRCRTDAFVFHSPQPGRIYNQQRSIFHPVKAVHILRLRQRSGQLNSLCTLPVQEIKTSSDSDLDAGCRSAIDRKSTRLNSSHRCISYAVFCLKKKNKKKTNALTDTS